MSCPSVPIDGGYLSAILTFVDCQAQQLGAAGYQALAAPGSIFSIILAVLLTVFVALFGYRMMLGHVPSVREGVMAFVKIGIVLTLATSWPPYQTLVYNSVFKGPAELTASIGGASGLPGAQGGMVARLENTDRMLMSLAVNGAGFPQTTEQAAQRTPPVLPGFDALALARIFYLAGIVGAFASVRILAGLLLALAPFFVAFLLFEGTRGLFEGWLRALLGAALGALGVGDSGAWMVSTTKRGDHLFIKPIQAGVSTNMTVVTDVRTYAFDLQPLPGPSPMMAFNVRFSYPTAPAAGGEAKATATTVETLYRITGDRKLRPSALSDDGTKTYIEWPASVAMPAVYAINDQGREALVNGVVQDGLYVIDGVAKQLVFRIDRRSARATRIVRKAKP